MKKILILTAGLALLLWACKPDLKGELGEPANKIDGMSGTWEIASFKQQDPNNPIREERDLSEFYIVDGQTPSQLTFDKESKTYSVITGPGKNYFGTGGTWAFDNDEYPTYLYLYTGTDTLETLLGSVVRPSDAQLNIQLENFCEAADGSRTTTAIYTFTFNRLNP
jgi:hypothetical protein